MAEMQGGEPLSCSVSCRQQKNRQGNIVHSVHTLIVYRAIAPAAAGNLSLSSCSFLASQATAVSAPFFC